MLLIPQFISAQGTTSTSWSGSFFFLIIALLACIGICYYFQKKNKQVLNTVEELKKQNQDISKSNEELGHKIAEKDAEISTLTGNKRELEQILVAKIKENDSILREVEEREEATKRHIKDAETMQYGFFVETIHEMRTPLSLILGSLSEALTEKDTDRNLSTHWLSAYRNTLALQDLADQLIGARKVEDVARYLRIARYNIVELARQSCDLFVDWLEMNNVDFNFTAQADSLWVWIDRRKIEYAIRTLITNALKNTFTYGKVTLGISVERHSGRAYCVLFIQDEGLDENENTRRGLKPIEETMESLDGKFKKDTAPNGTTYTLYIPVGKKHLFDRPVEFVEPEGDLVKLDERQKEEISEFIQIVPQKKVTGKKLLIIDDSDQIRWFLKHVFGKEYEVVEARNGEEGVNLALSELPNLILCDVMMPIKDGFQACREIKSNSKTTQIPIVMLTAKVESEDVIMGIEAGADDYITKPFDIDILRSKINNLLKRRDQLKHYYTRSLFISEPSIAVTTGDDTEKEEPLSPFMQIIVDTVEENIDNPDLDAKIIADRLNMSLPTLYRKIKQYSDNSILEITRNIRLKRAAELLQTQRFPVHEVAEKVGFNDMATFRKRFTEQYGVTPSQYGIPAESKERVD